MKILSLIGLPLVLLSGLSLGILVTLYQRSSSDTVLVQDTLSATADLVHNVQLERGLSVGFFTSGAASPSEALQEQRTIVSTLRLEIHEVLSNADTTQMQPHTLDFIQGALHALSDLETFRNGIDNRSSTVEEILDFFTKLDMHLLETSVAFSTLIPDTELAEHTMALVCFLMAKDSFGLQRAAGLIGFSQGWSSENLLRFGAAVTQSNERLRVFKEITDSHSYELLHELFKDDRFQRFTTIGHAVLAQTSLSPEITAQEWFELSSDVIGELKAIETTMNARLMADLQYFDSSHLVEFVLTLAGALGMTITVVLASLTVARNITDGMTANALALEQIGAGQLEIDVPGQDRRDMVGKIAREAEILRGQAINKRQADDQLQKTASEQQFVSEQIGTGLSKLSNKVLSFRISEYFPEEFKNLRMDFNDLAVTLQGAMTTVRDTAKSVGSNAQTIAANMDDLSNRTESQASTLEHNTQVLNDITARVQDSAHSAQDAETISVETRSAVEHCEGIMDQTIAAMEHIKNSSKEITDITKVIEEIAFQTNLLAINAGVEAARAGEAGRGFSVVASEVHSLARRCASAVHQIEDVTLRSFDQVKSGSRLVTSAGSAMSDVSTQMSRISELIISISQNLNAQATHLTDVNDTIKEMEQITQSNVSMVSSTSGSAAQLFSQAQELNTLIAQFQLQDDEAEATPGPELGTDATPQPDAA